MLGGCYFYLCSRGIREGYLRTGWVEILFNPPGSIREASVLGLPDFSLPNFSA